MGLTVLVNAGPWVPVPPPGYGGIEAMVAALVPELRRRGVRVVLATVGTSTLEADHVVRTLPEGAPLVLAGPVAGVGDPVELARRLADRHDPVHAHPDAAYWREHVAPLVDGELVRWVGDVQGLAKERWLQTARVLLMPVRWAEPGATAVVEALARGIPVVGTRRGVLPELVREGLTGFLADDERGLADALVRAGGIRAADCRASVAAWTPAAVADRYVELYGEVVARARSRPRVRRYSRLPVGSPARMR